MFGKTKIATHWDGYPDGLGKDLKEIGLTPTLEQVIEVAKKHGIDFATKDVQEKTSMERFEQIAQKTKGKYTAQQLADLYYKEGRIITFGVQTASDYPIDEFNGYSDFAEYEYEISPTVLRYRALHGEYTKARRGKWVELNRVGATN